MGREVFLTGKLSNLRMRDVAGSMFLAGFVGLASGAFKSDRFPTGGVSAHERVVEVCQLYSRDVNQESLRKVGIGVSTKDQPIGAIVEDYRKKGINILYVRCDTPEDNNLE